ncbi:hypothetical protein [Kaarinaea lacus]
MNTRRKSPVLFAVLMLFSWMFVAPAAFADEMTQSLMFDDASYTAEVEKAHHKLHMLYGKATDGKASAANRLKARQEFLAVAQDINKKMHARVMTKDPKKGDALSHTDVLLSTHLLLMTADMLTTIKQNEWAIDPGLTGSE